jgi:DNA-binding NarL/FixJ family response regulator
MSAPSFLIVDDHPLFMEALQSALQAGFPGAHVDAVENLAEAKARLQRTTYTLILLDLKMPDVNGVEGLRELRAKASSAPVAVISALGGAEIVAQIKAAGAKGFINKSHQRSEILKLVGRLLAGECVFPPIVEQAQRLDQDSLVDRLRQLTPQQLKVLQRVCEAKLNKQIAFELSVTETTVKAHITLIFKKLGVHSRTQAVLQLQRIKSELEDSEFSMLLQQAA